MKVKLSPRSIACHQVSSENARARRLGIPGIITTDEWQALCEKYNGLCLSCGTGGLMSIDHVIPLSRGGEHTMANIQPLCSECNRRKFKSIIDYRSKNDQIVT